MLAEHLPSFLFSLLSIFLCIYLHVQILAFTETRSLSLIPQHRSWFRNCLIQVPQAQWLSAGEPQSSHAQTHKQTGLLNKPQVPRSPQQLLWTSWSPQLPTHRSSVLSSIQLIFIATLIFGCQTSYPMGYSHTYTVCTHAGLSCCWHCGCMDPSDPQSQPNRQEKINTPLLRTDEASACLVWGLQISKNPSSLEVPSLLLQIIESFLWEKTFKFINSNC